jgi:hypothetical protein
VATEVYRVTQKELLSVDGTLTFVSHGLLDFWPGGRILTTLTVNTFVSAQRERRLDGLVR